MNRLITRRAPRALLVLALWTLMPCRAYAHPGSGIAVDDRGAVYFTDTGRGVWRIEPGGDRKLVSDNALHWMAIDRVGGFADGPDDFAEFFWRATPRGAKPALVLCSDFPFAIGKDGNLYYARMHSPTIVRRTPAGAESILVDGKKLGIAADAPAGVNGVACAPDGSVYSVTIHSLNRTVGTGEHAIYAVAPDGSVRTVAKDFVKDVLPPDQQPPEVRPQYCRGLAVDGDGNVFVAVTGNRCVMKLSPSGEAGVVLRCEKPWKPTGVDVRGGEVYVLEYDDETPVEGREWPPRVRKVARDGAVSTVAAITRGPRK